MKTQRNSVKTVALLLGIVSIGAAAITFANKSNVPLSNSSSPATDDQFYAELFKTSPSAENEQIINHSGLKCGEGKSGKEDSGEDKCGSGKCGDESSGESKCGDGKSGNESSGESKCGDGKCGSEKKDNAKETTDESKSAETSD